MKENVLGMEIDVIFLLDSTHLALKEKTVSTVIDDKGLCEDPLKQEFPERYPRQLQYLPHYVIQEGSSLLNKTVHKWFVSECSFRKITGLSIIWYFGVHTFRIYY
jgi:hypothetical protein